MGSSFTSAAVCPALSTGSYSYNTFLSEGKQTIMYLMMESSGVSTGFETAMR